MSLPPASPGQAPPAAAHVAARWRWALRLAEWAALAWALGAAPAAGADGLPDLGFRGGSRAAAEGAPPPLTVGSPPVAEGALYRRGEGILIQVGPQRSLTTIQAGIDAARSGDVVRVDPGVYFENLRFDGQAVAVVAAGGPEETTLDGRGCVGGGATCSAVTFTGGGRAWLEGFTILGGKGTILPEADRAALDPRAPRGGGARLGAPTVGGGVLIRGAAPTVARCVIRGGQSTYGGGVAVLGGMPSLAQDPLLALRGARRGGSLGAALPPNAPADPQLIEVSVVDNLALLSGGGIYVDSATLTVEGGRISGNEAYLGGGLAAVEGRIFLSRVELLKDRAGSHGGALHLSRASRVTAVESALVAGWAADGALAFVKDSALELDGGWAAFPHRGDALTAEGRALITADALVAWAEGRPLVRGPEDAIALTAVELRNPRFADLEDGRSWREDDLGAWRNGDPSAIPSLQVLAAAAEEVDSLTDPGDEPAAALGIAAAGRGVEVEALQEEGPGGPYGAELFPEEDPGGVVVVEGR